MLVLVTYATKAGSTRGIAQAIAKELRADGDEVTIHPATRDLSAEDYDAVIVGSAVRGRRWMKGASDFLEANRETLAHKPVAYFSACLAILHKGSTFVAEAARYAHYPLSVVPEVAPTSNTVFAGALDESALAPGERLFVKAFGIGPGDYRDWDVIRSWTRETHSAFAKALVPAAPTKVT